MFRRGRAGAAAGGLRAHTHTTVQPRAHSHPGPSPGLLLLDLDTLPGEEGKERNVAPEKVASSGERSFRRLYH